MNIIITVTAIGVLAMLSEIFNFRKALYPLTLLILLAAIGLSAVQWQSETRYFSDMLYMDHYAIAFAGVMLFTTLIWFMMVESFLKNNPRQADYTAIVAFSLGGALIMVGYADLIMLFLGVEILSISMYILAASRKEDPRSNEAGFKYFIMGAFASGFLLFGIALIYGYTGFFNLREIAGVISTHQSELPAMAYAGLLLIMIGLIFKVAAAPFHFWAPDVYDGSPTPFTAYMSTVVKTAAFGAFLRLFTVCFSGLSAWWGPVLAGCAAVSMLLGSLMALRQDSLKRLLAWSGVSNAGYMLMAVVCMNQYSASSLLLYAAAYSIGSIGIFSLLMSMTEAGNEKISSLHGFGRTNRFPAFVICIVMLSIAGIPPLAGFFAKYSVFTGAVSGGYLWLTILAVISSLVGVFYYLKVVVAMFQPAERETPLLVLAPGQTLVLGVVLVMLFALGIAPWLLTELV